RHTRSKRDWSSDVCSSDLQLAEARLASHIGSEEASMMRLRPDARRSMRFREGVLQSRIHNIEGGGEFARQEALKQTGEEAEALRSEERRVGKEGRGGWGAC